MTQFKDYATQMTLSSGQIARSIDMIALAENPLAIAEGDATAPSINPGALSIGGTGFRGDDTSGTKVLNTDFDRYFSHYGNLTLNTSFTLPGIDQVWYIAGDLNIGASCTITGSGRNTSKSSGFFDGNLPANTSSTVRAGGGGHPLGGVGGDANTNGYDSSLTSAEKTAFRQFYMRPVPGTAGGINDTGGNGKGGAGLTILCNGTITIDGTINCNGSSPSTNDGGGGGGGAICIASLTQITGTGTLTATGDGVASGDGGGGYIKLMAPDYTGYSPTVSVNSPNQGGAGNGYYDPAILNREQIRSIIMANGLLSYYA